MKQLRVPFVALLLLRSLSPHLAQGADSTDAMDATSIEYASVADALAALKVKPGVKVRTQGGMIIVEDPDSAHPATWIFLPKTHPAYPTVIKRSISNTKEGAFMETQVKCEASQKVCDKYFGGDRKPSFGGV